MSRGYTQVLDNLILHPPEKYIQHLRNGSSRILWKQYIKDQPEFASAGIHTSKQCQNRRKRIENVDSLDPVVSDENTITDTDKTVVLDMVVNTSTLIVNNFMNFKQVCTELCLNKPKPIKPFKFTKELNEKYGLEFKLLIDKIRCYNLSPCKTFQAELLAIHKICQSYASEANTNKVNYTKRLNKSTTKIRNKLKYLKQILNTLQSSNNNTITNVNELFNMSNDISNNSNHSNNSDNGVTINHNNKNNSRFAKIRQIRKTLKAKSILEAIEVITKRIEFTEKYLFRKIECAKIRTVRYLFKARPSLRLVSHISSEFDNLLQVNDSDEIQKKTSELCPKKAYEFFSSLSNTKYNCNKPTKLINQFIKALEKSDIVNKNIIITKQDVELAINNAAPWKACGPDLIPAGVLKNIPALREWTCTSIMHMLKYGKLTSSTLAHGRTVLLKKKGDLTNPANWRPITCLSHIYKILTSAINIRLERETRNSLLRPVEQMANKPGVWGCQEANILDQLLNIDKFIYGNKTNKQPLAVAWIDFKKAYDSVSQSLLRRILSKLRLGSVNSLLNDIMSSWRTQLVIDGKKKSPFYPIRRGVFQGDALSPLFFIFIMAPLSFHLNKNPKIGLRHKCFKRENKLNLNHLIYMDDVKLYAENKKKLKHLVYILKKYGNEVGLDVNDDKCNVLGTTTSISSFAPLNSKNDYYKYLGVPQTTFSLVDTAINQASDKIGNFINSLYQIDLGESDRVKALNISIAPMLRYLGANSCFVSQRIDCIVAQLEGLDQNIKNQITSKKAWAKGLSRERFWIERTNGGKGVPRATMEFVKGVASQLAYSLAGTHTASHEMTKLIQHCESTNWLVQSPLIALRKMLTQLKLISSINLNTNPTNNLNQFSLVIDNTLEIDITRGNPAQLQRMLWTELDLRYQAKLEELASSKEGWKIKKTMDTILDAELTNNAMERLNGNPKMERNLFMAKEIQLNTNQFTARIGMIPADKKNCRFGCSMEETLGHVLVSCQKNLKHLFYQRHQAVAFHFEKVLRSILATTDELIIDKLIETDALLHHKRPDFIWKRNKIKEFVIFEVALALPENLETQRKCKIIRYSKNGEVEVTNHNITTVRRANNLVDALEQQWRMKGRVVPIVLGVCGEIHKLMQQELIDHLGLSTNTIKMLINNMQIAAMRFTHRAIANHLGHEK